MHSRVKSASKGSSRIVSVEACAVEVPLDRVTAMATRVVRVRQYTLVKIWTADGHAGIGFTYAGTNGSNLIAHAIRELLAPLLIGENSVDMEPLWNRLYHDTILLGRAGVVMRALSMLDIALWDRNSRARGLPLYRLLKDQRVENVEAYASAGYYGAGKTNAMLAREMADLVERGFNAVKMKVGRLSPKKEELRVAAVRDAIGPRIHLMLDANGAWPDLATALLYTDRFEKFEPYWIEEPFGPDDIDSHAELARRCRTPVSTGETEAGRWRFEEIMQKKAARIIQPDATVCGGISEYRRIAASAARHDIDVAPHWFHDLHIHLAATTANTRWVEFLPDSQVFNFRKLLDRQIVCKAGRLMMPDSPGLGFNFDAKAVNKYAISRWK
jgi:L-alanine-DL-glutamate epimerase-like enolase superfamily enzyme